jgi:HK97 family phage prohead protease
MLAKGQAMRNPAGDPSYPIGDEEDLSNAIHAVGLGGAANASIRRYIMGRAKAMGKTSMIPDTWQADGSLSGRAMVLPPTAYTRSFALEDISIRAGGDGRTVEAYAAVFNTPVPIRDADGEYTEVIDPTCFDRAITRSKQSGKQIPILFNHGMTIWSTPSDMDSMPIGVTEEIRPDGRGLLTRARYHRSDRADQALEAIREGSITAYSFSGAFSRSTPEVRRGQRLAPDRRTGALPTLRRMESTLREYGPTPFPAYSDAAIVGVRAEQAIALLGQLHPAELERLVGIVRTGTHPGGLSDAGTDPDGSLVAEDLPAGHSVRSHSIRLARIKRGME